MSGATQRDSGRDRQARRRLAAFALVSVALHAGVLAVFQAGARRGPVAAPEPLAVQFVELEPPAAPEPDMPDIPDELPDQPPQEIPQQPEPQPEPAPEPQIPNEPAPEPEIPQEPAETPEIPAPAPTPVPSPAPDSGAVMAPEPEDTPDEGASLIVPGLTYRSGSDSPLVRFGHVIECASLNRRYDEDCADVGPVYLTEREMETLMPGGRLAPEIERYFRARMAAETERDTRIQRNSNAAMPNPNVCGDFACIPESGWGRLRDNPAVRRALEEAGID